MTLFPKVNINLVFPTTKRSIMVPRKKQILSNTQLPLLADVIAKVKQYQDLTPEEELVYLIYIENVPEENARKIIESKFEDSEND